MIKNECAWRWTGSTRTYYYCLLVAAEQQKKARKTIRTIPTQRPVVGYCSKERPRIINLRRKIPRGSLYDAERVLYSSLIHNRSWNCPIFVGEIFGYTSASSYYFQPVCTHHADALVPHWLLPPVSHNGHCPPVRTTIKLYRTECERRISPPSFSKKRRPAHTRTSTRGVLHTRLNNKVLLLWFFIRGRRRER